MILAYKETERGLIFFLLQVSSVSYRFTNLVPRDCKYFPLKTGFRNAESSFKTGFTVWNKPLQGAITHYHTALLCAINCFCSFTNLYRFDLILASVKCWNTQLVVVHKMELVCVHHYVEWVIRKSKCMLLTVFIACINLLQ